jgi:predicted DsbA family dithiol-disulfide isomerase
LAIYGVAVGDAGRERRIEVFADVYCPFAYAGLRRLLDRRYEVAGGFRLHVRAWPLELVNGRPLRPLAVAREVEALRSQVVPQLFTGFDREAFPATTLPALALAASAYDVDLSTGEAVSMALRHALFEEGLDVSRPQVLAELAAAHRVPAPQAHHGDRVRADWEEGRRRGVVGSPHFFAGDRSFFCPALRVDHGQDGLRVTPTDDVLSDLLDAIGTMG